MRKISWDNSTLSQLVPICYSIRDVLGKLGLTYNGGNHRTVKTKIQLLGLDTSHFDPYKPARLRGKVVKIPYEKVLIENSIIDSSSLRNIVFRNKLLDYVCALCGKEPYHNGKELVLPLDHINGDRCDNRLVNLRFLCPNCHTQTPTFGNKIKRAPKSEIQTRPLSDFNIHISCEEALSKYLECKSYSKVAKDLGVSESLIRKLVKMSGQQTFTKKVLWPSDDDLRKMIWEEPATVIATKLHVSSTAVKQHCIKRGIATPPRGYWS